MTVYHPRTGTEVVTITCTSSPDPPAVIPGAHGLTIVLAITATDKHDLILPADADIGSIVEIYPDETSYVALHPPSGGSIGAKGTDEAANIGQPTSGNWFRKVTDTLWKTDAANFF